MTRVVDTMVSAPRPTRAEATDVANAVLDGTDCVMLSGETAKGKYPIQAIEMMVSICREAEKVLDDEQYNQFAYELYGVVTRTDHKHTTRYYCATAAQRAEAFLRALGKWKQD